MAAVLEAVVTEAQKQQFRDEGYLILERVISPEHLELLREECRRFIELEDAKMERLGSASQGITHRNKRYFISQRYKESARLHEFIFSPLMAEICRATLGPTAFLFWEQFVVKGAEVGMKFGWHQDSGYVGFPHRPYLTCWCALDDMSAANGTAYILPYSRAGGRDLVAHTREPGSNDLIGYSGDDPGIPVLAPAGSIAVFSSLTFHRSGTNTTSQARRVYLPQYSAEPIVNKKDGKPKPSGWVEPFLQDGNIIYQR